MMKRYLSLWLPDWPLDRLRRTRRAMKSGTGKPHVAAPKPRQPFVLLESGAAGLNVVAANAPARAQGITFGLKFTDARARLPSLASEDIDRAADAAALTTLAKWMIRYTPLIALDGIDGLMLETTGCAHLHGGEAEMAARMTARLSEDGITHTIGLAGTPGAASALARGAQISGPNILPNGDEQAGLADLPVTALRLSSEATALLRRFGLTRIGQLYGIDRKALARRFRSVRHADAVLLRLDQALGLRVEPLDPLRPAPAYSARLPCPEPIASTDGVLEGLRRVTDTLCADLAALGQGARLFAFHAFRSDGTASSIEVSAARPVRSARHILRLFHEKIDAIDPGFGIDLLLIQARRTGPMTETAMALSGDLATSDTDEIALSALADRISAKLGETAITLHQPAHSHVPERRERRIIYDGKLAPPIAHQPSMGPRPLRLLDPPEPVTVLAEVPDGPPLSFVWRRIPRKVARADGPERIAPEWWKLEEKGARARDYYRVEDQSGRRYWLYRDGLYDDGRGGPPIWHVHGLFA